MKKRLFYIFIVSSFTVLLGSSFLYYSICAGLKQTTRYGIGKFNFLLNDTTHFNTIFLGASSSHHGINPELFDSLTGGDSYNAAINGLGIAEINLIAHKMIKRHGAPRNVFIGLDEATLSTGRGVSWFAQYYPYVNDSDFNEIIREEPKLLYGRYFPPLAMACLDDPLKALGLTGFLRLKLKSTETPSIRGYLPIPSTDKIQVEQPPQELDYESTVHGWEMLQEVLQLCTSNNIEFYIIVPPRYGRSFCSVKTQLFLKKLQSFEEKYHISIIDYSLDKRFNTKDFFVDNDHLNETGARQFTIAVSEDFLKNQ